MSDAAQVGRPAWGLLGVRPPRCPFGAHRQGGSLDESARRLSHSELGVAELLAGEGHRVRALAERPGQGRTADLDVCGQAVEVKAWMGDASLRARAPGARSVFNKLAAARGQGATAVLWARGSGLQAVDADRGVALFASTGRFGGIRSVRVVGDGYDLAWGFHRELRPDRRAVPTHPAVGRDRGIGGLAGGGR